MDNNKELAEYLDGIGRKILMVARDELYIGMRFMDVALSSFIYQMDLSIDMCGTDGMSIFFEPQKLGALYKENRLMVNRAYLHMVFHCIFRHFLKTSYDELMWDISCDIAVEHMIDKNHHRSIRAPRSLLRRDTYSHLEKEGKTLNAERIYKYLMSWDMDTKKLQALRDEFMVDDHKYWSNKKPDEQPNPDLNKKWNDIDEKMETDMETFSKEASEKAGDLVDHLKVENRKKHDYKTFLRKFMVFREELETDPDTFDQTFYSYGLQLYGNMPLIEPIETKEVKKISEIAVVIDTSMSCQQGLVKRFLEETYTVLADSENYFRKFNVHIIQSDEKVQSDVSIENAQELAEYMNDFEILGGGGTDFRPAFEYIENLMENGTYEDLKGIIYFTDGYGTFPVEPAKCKTAFIFMEDDYKDVDVPAWAIKLILTEGQQPTTYRGGGLQKPC